MCKATTRPKVLVQFTQLSSHITKTVLMLFWDERDYHITYLTIYLQSFEYLPICNCAKLRDANGAHALLVCTSFFLHHP